MVSHTIPERNAVNPASFERPVHSFLCMLLSVLLVAAGFFAFQDQFNAIFRQSPYLNGIIGAVFVFGGCACFWQVWQITWAVVWIERFLNSKDREHWARPPRLLAPLASMLRSSGSKMQLSATSSRTILDSVASRMDESRDFSRYIAHLLIFLGLLGTFYGLARTIPAVLDTMSSISPPEDEGPVDALEMVTELKTGIESQLGGMGVAFSSSLLGLAGSLLVGLLDLLAGHGQNRFYRQLEEWLSSITRINTSDFDADVGLDSGAGIGVALGDMVEDMRHAFAASEKARSASKREIRNLNAAVAELAKVQRQRTETEQQYTLLLEQLKELAAEQSKIAASMEGLAAGMADDEAKLLLRSMELQLVRLVEENVDIRTLLEGQTGLGAGS